MESTAVNVYDNVHVNSYMVVAWNGDVDVTERRVGIAEGYHRNVDVRCLSHSLKSI